jgi:nitrate/nitrite-specific signal transduction histidine kinase
MSEELAESYAVLEQRVQEKPPDWSTKTDLFPVAGQPSSAFAYSAVRTFVTGASRPANLTLLHDIELRVYDLEDEKTIRNSPAIRILPVMIEGAIYVRAASCLLPLAAVPP